MAPKEGQGGHWSFFTETLRKKEGIETINREKIRLILTKSSVKPGEKNVVHHNDQREVYRFLELYVLEYDRSYHVVCIDKKSKLPTRRRRIKKGYVNHTVVCSKWK